MALISQSDLEARIGRALTSEEQSAFTLINAANQAYVERLIGSSVESVSATTRYYDGGLVATPIDPCTGVTSVGQVDSDYVSQYTYDTSDYTLDPINSTIKQMVRSRIGKLIKGYNYIAVTAKFSIYDDVNIRNIVKNAMMEALVSEMGDSDNIQKESIEGYSVEYSSSETKHSLDAIKYLFPGII